MYKALQIHFLGTSSAVPTLARNVTCNVIRFHTGRLWIVDCGEGTQLRFLQQGLVFERVDRIFITHLHGDHSYGIFGLLCMLKMKNMNKGSPESDAANPSDNLTSKTRPRIEVIGPKGLKKMVDDVFRASGTGIEQFVDLEFIELDIADWNSWDTPERIALGIKKETEG